MTEPLKSWVPDTDDSGSPITALPYGVAGPAGKPALYNAIGPFALNLAGCASDGLLDVDGLNHESLSSASLNSFLGHNASVHRRLRKRVQVLLSEENYRSNVERHLVLQNSLLLRCPIEPGDFIDFYSSYHHAVRSMKAAGVADPSPADNWHSMPVGYHSRTSTIFGSGCVIDRPIGQRQSKSGSVLAPSVALDFELEIGFVACGPKTSGIHISPDHFDERVFGLVLLNDWSARDFQAWEAAPLGPLLSKSFASQIGSWILPLEALDACRVLTPSQATALEYLRHDEPWGFDIDLEVSLQSAKMRKEGQAPQTITRTNFGLMTWNGAQQLSHATVNGSAVRPGDLFGSGTVSGPELSSAGCLMELSNAGRTPLELECGESRRWLLDGDQITISGRTLDSEGRVISLGDLRGVVGPARDCN